MLMHDKRVRELLLAEIDMAELSSIAIWEGSQRLTYLDAVIQKRLLFRSPVGMALRRAVPSEGTVRCSECPARCICCGGLSRLETWAVAHLSSIWSEKPKKSDPRGGFDSKASLAEIY